MKIRVIAMLTALAACTIPALAAETPRVAACDMSAAQKGGDEAPAQPFRTLRREIERLFDDFEGGWQSPLRRAGSDVEPIRGQITSGLMPVVDIADTANAYEVSAELPGLDEKNIQVSFSDGMLTIKGEKTEEKEEKKKDYSVSERRYGSFQRSFSIPGGVDAEKINATFKNGVLTVSLPKGAEVQNNVKKIEIKAH